MSDVLVVIVSYNNPSLTVRAVETASRQTVPTDVVVWDNNSPDALVAQVLKAHPLNSNVELVMSEENLLWTPALNAAVERFLNGHDYLCFMNNDITLPGDAIERMVQVFRDHPDAALVGPMGWSLGGPQDYATHKEAWLAAGKGADESFQAQGAYRIPYVVGACTLVSRVVWDELGVLDAEMPLGADDHDYSLRAKDAGYAIYAEPAVVAQHAGHASAGSPNWNKWGAKSWDAFNRKWDGYFVDATEATNCHWGGTYIPGWEVGTGWLPPEEREIIKRGRSAR